MQKPLHQLIIGIIGGGQLGKMLLAETNRMQLNTAVLDPDPEAPCSFLTQNFTVGSLTDFDTVFAFGMQCDIITIEIEHVNCEALFALEAVGKLVYPYPSVLEKIQDKGLQKTTFAENEIPTAPFTLFANLQQLQKAVMDKAIALPFIWKSRKGGYDGKGVKLVKQFSDLDCLPNVPCLAENVAPIILELAVIVATSHLGETKYYDPAAMIFDQKANLVLQVEAPANIDIEIRNQAIALALKTAKAFLTPGLLAVEMFLNADGKLWVNEIAPRPHNSAHYTIEACFCGQFEQHIRAICGLPLGDTEMQHKAIMLNLLGESGHLGKPNFIGLEHLFSIKGSFLHLYGKKQTKPMRKMGHITLLGNNFELLQKQASNLLNLFKITSL